jgi:hypothetical protein
MVDLTFIEHVPIELNRTSPVVIAGLDPAIHAAKTLHYAGHTLSTAASQDDEERSVST